MENDATTSKILYVSKNTIPAKSGGAPERTDKVTKELADKGHDVVIVCGKIRSDLPPVKKGDREIRHVPCLPDILLNKVSFSKYLCYSIFPLASFFYLIKYMYDEDVDVVVDSMAPVPSLAVLAAKIYRTPIVGFVHGFFDRSMYEHYHPITATIQLLVQNLLRIFEYDTLVCPTSYIQRELIEYGVDRDRIEIIPNGLDTSNYTPQLSEEQRNGLVTVGRLAKIKSQDTVIHAYAQVCERLETVPPLHVVGSGPMRDELEALVTRLELEKQVLIHGYLEEEAKVDLLCESDAFVYGSRWESFGIVLLEAMAAGLPIVATHQRAYEDFFEDGKNGYLVVDDDEALADGLVSLLSDDDVIEEMREQNITEAEKYSWSKIGDQMEQTLLQSSRKVTTDS